MAAKNAKRPHGNVGVLKDIVEVNVRGAAELRASQNGNAKEIRNGGERDAGGCGVGIAGMKAVQVGANQELATMDVARLVEVPGFVAVDVAEAGPPDNFGVGRGGRDRTGHVAELVGWLRGREKSQQTR